MLRQWEFASSLDLDIPQIYKANGIPNEFKPADKAGDTIENVDMGVTDDCDSKSELYCKPEE